MDLVDLFIQFTHLVHVLIILFFETERPFFFQELFHGGDIRFQFLEIVFRLLFQFFQRNFFFGFFFLFVFFFLVGIDVVFIAIRLVGYRPVIDHQAGGSDLSDEIAVMRYKQDRSIVFAQTVFQGFLGNDSWEK